MNTININKKNFSTLARSGIKKRFYICVFFFFDLFAHTHTHTMYAVISRRLKIVECVPVVSSCTCVGQCLTQMTIQK